MRYDKVQLQGKLWLQSVADKDTTRHRTGTDKGRFIYSQVDEKLYFGGNTDWVKIVDSQDILETGTKMLIGSFPIPDSWNVSVDNDDIAVLITNVSNTVGDTGGTWTIDSLTGTTGSHFHGGSTGQATNHIAHLGASEISGTVPIYTHRHNIQVDGLHKHTFDGQWRPSHVKLCEVIYI